MAGKSRQPTPEHAPSNYPCALCVQCKSYSSSSKSTGSAVAGLGPWIILGRSLTVQRAEDQSKNNRRALVLPAISSLVKSSTIFYRDRTFRTNAPYKDHLPVHLAPSTLSLSLSHFLSPATFFFSSSPFHHDHTCAVNTSPLLFLAVRFTFYLFTH